MKEEHTERIYDTPCNATGKPFSVDELFHASLSTDCEMRVTFAASGVKGNNCGLAVNLRPTGVYNTVRDERVSEASLPWIRARTYFSVCC